MRSVRRKIASVAWAALVAVAAPARAQSVDLSPRAAARGFLGDGEPAEASGPAERDSTSQAPARAYGEASRTERVRQNDGGMSTSLASAPRGGFAVRSPFPRRRSAAPDDVPLERRPDGTYYYNGNGFNAVIGRDGSTKMVDKFGKTEFFKPTQLADGSWGFAFFRFKFDLITLLEKLYGNDSFRSERRRFFEGTRELRDRLASAAQPGVLARTLEKLWSTAGLSFAERRRRTFELWADQAQDELGRIGRALIVRFVQQRCPAGSACAFSEQELRELNSKRAPRDPFLPYAP